MRYFAFFIKFIFYDIIAVKISAYGDESMGSVKLSDLYENEQLVKSMINNPQCIFKLSDFSVQEHEARRNSIFYCWKRSYTMPCGSKISWEPFSKTKKFKKSNFKDLRFKLKDSINKGFGSNNKWIEIDLLHKISKTDKKIVGDYHHDFSLGSKCNWIPNQLSDQDSIFDQIEVLCSSCSQVCLNKKNKNDENKSFGSLLRQTAIDSRNVFLPPNDDLDFFSIISPKSESSQTTFFSSNSTIPEIPNELEIDDFAARKHQQCEKFHEEDPSSNNDAREVSQKERRGSFIKDLSSAIQSTKFQQITTPANSTGLHFHREIILPPIDQSKVLDSTKWPPQGTFDLTDLNPESFQNYDANLHGINPEEFLSLYFFQYDTKTLIKCGNVNLKGFFSAGRVQHLKNQGFQQTHDAIASLRDPMVKMEWKVPAHVAFTLEPLNDVGTLNTWRLIVRAMLNPNIPFLFRKYTSAITPVVLQEINHQDSPFNPMIETLIKKFIDNYWKNNQ